MPTEALKAHIVSEMKKKEEEYKDVPESERPESFLDLKMAIDGPYGTPSDVSAKYCWSSYLYSLSILTFY